MTKPWQNLLWDVWDASSFTGLSERTVQRRALAMGAAKDKGRYSLTSMQVLAMAPNPRKTLCCIKLELEVLERLKKEAEDRRNGIHKPTIFLIEDPAERLRVEPTLPPHVRVVSNWRELLNEPD